MSRKIIEEEKTVKTSRVQSIRCSICNLRAGWVEDKKLKEHQEGERRPLAHWNPLEKKFSDFDDTSTFITVRTELVSYSHDRQDTYRHEQWDICPQCFEDVVRPHLPAPETFQVSFLKKEEGNE